MTLQQKLKTVFLISCCTIVTGCVTSYKDVMQDKDAYLDSNFKAEQLNPATLALIKKRDKEGLGFTKIVVKERPNVITAATELNKIEKENTLTLTNRGGALIAGQEDDFSNGVLSQSSFSLSYRGILNLRYQFVRPGAINASRIVESKDFTDFSSAASLRTGMELNYNYVAAPTIQIANLKRFSMHCKVGSEFAANTIRPELEGNAFNVSCQEFDEFSVSIASSELIYLEKYGFAIKRKRSTSTFTTVFEITEIQIVK
jgi:hypothetical protein